MKILSAVSPYLFSKYFKRCHLSGIRDKNSGLKEKTKDSSKHMFQKLNSWNIKISRIIFIQNIKERNCVNHCPWIRQILYNSLLMAEIRSKMATPSKYMVDLFNLNQNLQSFLSIWVKKSVKCHCQVTLFAKQMIILNDV